jgi:hypothetical protein
LKNINQTANYLIKKISSTKLWGKSFLLRTFLFLNVIFFSACKDENELGLDVLPPGDQLTTVFSDTARVNTRTLREDSLRTDELSLQLLGSDLNTVFGLTTASVYTQVNLEGTPSFNNEPVADSLVLVLAYSGYYGDTSTTQGLNVYRLTESMYADSGYFSDRVFSHDPGVLGSISYTPHPYTQVVVGNDTVAAQLRIRLDQALADSMIALNGSSVFNSNADWLNYFQGLYLESTPVAGEGAISYFNFFNSKLVLYFHDTTDVTLVKSYNFSLTGARLNHFDHDYSGSEAGMQLSDSTFRDSINYLHAMAGLKVRISFPFLKHFVDSGSIVINRAELKISANYPVVPYPLPQKMLLVIKDANGLNSFPIDYFESSGYYGGDINTTGDGYSFNISRHLQRYLDGTLDNAEFYLIISASGVESTRAIIKSGSNLDTRMKLALTYTKLN